MPDFGLAGAEIMCEHLVYELIKIGDDVSIISFYDCHTSITERLEQAGVKIFYLNKRPGLDLSIIPKIRRILKDEKPDIIHTHRYVMEYAIPAAYRLKIKKIHTIHNIASKENTKYGQYLNSIFFKYCNTIPVALSEAICDTLMERYKLEREQIPVIYNGISLDQCIVKQDYAITEDIHILHIGRYAESKNHREMLKAIHELRTSGRKVNLTLVGEGPLQKDVCQLIKENHMENYVCVYGISGNIYPLLQNADLFILPSIYEGMPMTLIEAMGSGLPIVASNVGGIPNMITDGENGLLCTPKCNSIKSCIEKMLDDPVGRERMGKNAIRSAKQFSSERMGKNYHNLYQQL